MMLRRLMIEIGNDPYLSSHVALTGGTTLQHVLLDSPLRYSEDLDLLMRVPAPGTLKEFYQAWRERIGKRLGVLVHSQAHTEYPKVRLMWKLDAGEPMTITVDLARNPVNVRIGERATERTIEMDTSWFSGSCRVYCIQPADLAATKLAACSTRQKARDLYDLYTMREPLAIDEAEMIERFVNDHMDNAWSLEAAREIASKHLAKDYRRQVEVEQEGLFVPDDYDIEAASNVYMDLASKVDSVLRARSVALPPDLAEMLAAVQETR